MARTGRRTGRPHAAAIARLSRRASEPEPDLLALRIASADFASLLVQLAANAAASGQARGAPEEPSAELAAKLSSVIGELASHAHEVERPVSDRADVVAHHLAAGLRVRFSQETLQRLGASSPGRIADWTLLDRLRDPWLRLATHSTRPRRRSTLSSLPRRTNAPTPRQRDRRRRRERDLRRPPGWPAGGVSSPPGVAPPSGRVDLCARGVRRRTPRPRSEPRPGPADHAHATRARHGRDRADRPRPRSPRRGSVALAAADDRPHDCLVPTAG